MAQTTEKRAPTEVPPSASRSRNWVRNRLLAGTLVLFLARLVLSLIRTGPLVVADEIGYLTNARVLVGDLAGQLQLAPFYRGGYSLLLAPIVGLSSDPDLSYHLILALNAVLAASLFPLLYLLLVRTAGTPPRVAIWAALAGAAYPALTVLSQVALSENALFPLVCVWLLAFSGLLAARGRRDGLLWSLGLALSASALWVVHYRMVGAILLTGGAVIWLGARRRLSPAAVVAALLVLAIGIWATSQLDHFVIDHNYAGQADSEAGDRLDALLHDGGLWNAAANLIGQSWYLLVSTFGLAAMVVADVLGRLRARRRDAGEGPPPAALALVALTAILLLISAAAFPERVRPDQLIYGRYVEAVTPPLVALGLVLLASRRAGAWAKRIAVALAVLSAGVIAIRAAHVDPGEASRWNVSALPFVTGQLGPAILLAATVIAAAGGWLLLRVSRAGTVAASALALALFLAVAAYGAWNPVVSSQRGAYPSGWSSPEPVAGAERIAAVAYDLDRYDTFGLYSVQWFLPDTSVRFLHPGDGRPLPRYVLSSRDWAREHPGGGWTLIWSDQGHDQAIWRRGGAG
jgi:hypothetical protein